MSQKQKILMRRFIWVVIAQFVLHGLILLVQPNGVNGNNWLGYSSSRFMLLTASLLVAACIFLLRKQIWMHEGLFAAVNNRFAGNLIAFGLLLISALVLASVFYSADTWALTTQALLLYLRPTLFLALLLAVELAVVAILLVNVPVSQKIYWFLAFGILVTYILVRLYNYLQLGDPYTTADSAAYTGFPTWAEMLAPLNFWSGTRPFVVPLLGTLVGQNLVYFVWVQTGVSIFCWALLALSLAAQFRIVAMKVFVLVSVLAFSLSRHILVWDWTVMSESLSLSLMALLLGSFARLGAGFTWSKASLVVIVSFLWAFTRDANVWIVLLVSIVILLVVFIRRIPRQWLVLSGMLFLVFVLSSLSASSPRVSRGAYPLMHAIIVDVLPNGHAVEYFAERGMPFTKAMAGWPEAFPHHLSLWQEDDFDSFYNWTAMHGRKVYLSYLLSTAPASLLMPIAPEHFPVRMGTEFNRPYEYESPLPLQVEDIFYFGLWSVMGRLVVVILLLFALWRAWTMRDAVATLAFFAVVLAYPYIFLGWYGDGLSRARHILPAEILLRLGCLLLVLVLVNIIAERITLQLNSAGVELTVGI